MYPDPKPLPSVEEPEHYTRLKPQPIDVILAWGLNYPLGSAVKYLARAGYKPGSLATDDLRKAISFINKEIARLESHPGVSLPVAKPGSMPKVSDQ